MRKRPDKRESVRALAQTGSCDYVSIERMLRGKIAWEGGKKSVKLSNWKSVICWFSDTFAYEIVLGVIKNYVTGKIG